jgi:hypothetical protein
MNRFRPQDISPRYRLKYRIKYDCYVTYNWQTRHGYKRVKPLPLNRETLGRIFGRLHYLACHAPKPVRLKWLRAYNNFMKRYCAEGGRHSIKFANTYTAHAWL